MRPEDVSVVVPTFRRPDDLERCLASLAAQEAAGFEVLVVDNDADPAVRRLVESAPVGAARSLKYLAEGALGVHHARHAGARAAGGELLLFTDDDAECSSAWVGAYADALADPRMSAAGGPVRARFLQEPPTWVRELISERDRCEPYSLMDLAPDAVRPDRGFFYSINMAIRRDVLFELGGFNPEAHGPIWLGDGESGLNRKLWARGLTVGYVPDALVWHRIPPERMTFRYLHRRSRNQGAADAYTLLHPFPFRRRGLVRLLTRRLRTSPPTVLAAAATWRRRDPGAVRRRIAAFTALGELEYYARLLVRRDLWPLVRRERWL